MGVGCTLEYYGTCTSWFASLSECCCLKDIEISLYAENFIYGVHNKWHTWTSRLPGGDGETKGTERARKGKGRHPSGQLGRGAKVSAFPWTCSPVQWVTKSFCHTSPLSWYTFIGACSNSSFTVPIYDALNNWHMLNQVQVLQADWLLSIVYMYYWAVVIGYLNDFIRFVMCCFIFL